MHHFPPAPAPAAAAPPPPTSRSTLHHFKTPLSPSFTHYLLCSCGNTALKLAIFYNRDDVAAHLRSIGAPG
jgi:hypothetical protein